MDNQRTNCINCGGPVEPGIKKCAYCGTAVDIERKKIFNLLFKNKKFRITALYPMLLGIGLAIAIYIYLFAFDDFSETQLVSITPLWFFFIIFGLYGYFAEYLLKRIVVGDGKNIPAAYKKWWGKFLRQHPLIGLVLTVPLLPFSLIHTRNSLLIAFIGSIIWGILLLFFFKAVFPAL